MSTFRMRFSERGAGFRMHFGEIHPVSDGGYDRGYAEGEAVGYERGHADGYTEGHADGENSGYQKGYDAAYVEPYNGSYNVTPRNSLQTLATNGRRMTKNVTVQATGVVGDYTGSYTVTPKSTDVTLTTKNRRMTSNLTIKKTYEDGLIAGDATEIVNNSVTSVRSYAFYRNTTLTSVELGKAEEILSNAFYGCTQLQTLRLTNKSSVCVLSSTNALSGTPLASGTGKIYVPEGLYSSYRTDTNWATFSRVLAVGVG